MQEKCSFLLAHVEITAILAVFLDSAGKEKHRDEPAATKTRK